MANSKLLGFVAALAVFTSASAMADEYVCIGSVAGKTFDNVRVPQNKSCTLDRTRVKGTIKVEQSATLKAITVVVIGNVQAESAHKVSVLDGSRIGGSVQAVQGGAVTVSDSFVDSDILYDDNKGALKILRNEVGGNVQVFQNVGNIKIVENEIDGNLQCKENVPPPTGGKNVVNGSKEDQCSKL